MHIDSYVVNNLSTNLMVADIYTVYCKSFKVENFCGVEMNCNSLDNIHGYMVVLCGQILLHRDIIVTVTDQSAKTQNFSTLSICAAKRDQVGTKYTTLQSHKYCVLYTIFYFL